MILRYRRINTASWTSPHDNPRQLIAKPMARMASSPSSRRAWSLGNLSLRRGQRAELSARLHAGGAEVLLHPSNEPVSARADAPKLCRAAENMCYLISTNGWAALVSPTPIAAAIPRSSTSTAPIWLSRRSDAESNAASAMMTSRRCRPRGVIQAWKMPSCAPASDMYRDYFAKANFYPGQCPRRRAVRNYGELTPIHDQAVANLTKAG